MLQKFRSEKYRLNLYHFFVIYPSGFIFDSMILLGKNIFCDLLRSFSPYKLYNETLSLTLDVHLFQSHIVMFRIIGLFYLV